MSTIRNFFVILLLGATPLAAGIFARGDANGDSRIDVSDAIFVFNYLFQGGPTPTCLDAADANDDGGVDISDGIAILNHLFLASGPLPDPAPTDCGGGPDPTPDDLSCESGADPPTTNPPTATLQIVNAFAPDIRQRSRSPISETGPATYQTTAGTAFVLLLIAESNRISRAGFSLTDPNHPDRANPATVKVTADGPLGSTAAGQNLAPYFLNDIDPWHDRIYLTTHIALRIAGDGPLAPPPGTYTFTVTVTDANCVLSPPVQCTLEVLPAGPPEVFVWTSLDSDPNSPPLQHDPGSGNARVSPTAGFHLIIDAAANGTAPDPDPNSLRVTATPAIGGATDVTSLFTPVDSFPARFSRWFAPGSQFPVLGNTEFRITIVALEQKASRERVFILETQVSYADDIQPIWNTNCSGCHEEPDPFKGLVLVAPGEDPTRLRNHIVNVFASGPVIDSIAPLLVWPYFPERSYLLHKLDGTHLDSAVGGEGERMPQGGPPFLPPDTTHVIRSWVVQGAGAK